MLSAPKAAKNSAPLSTALTPPSSGVGVPADDNIHHICRSIGRATDNHRVLSRTDAVSTPQYDVFKARQGAAVKISASYRLQNLLVRFHPHHISRLQI